MLRTTTGLCFSSLNPHPLSHFLFTPLPSCFSVTLRKQLFVSLWVRALFLTRTALSTSATHHSATTIPQLCSTERKEAVPPQPPNGGRHSRELGSRGRARTRLWRLSLLPLDKCAATLQGETRSSQKPARSQEHDVRQKCQRDGHFGTNSKQGAKGDAIDGTTTPETAVIRSWSVDSKGLRTKTHLGHSVHAKGPVHCR